MVAVSSVIINHTILLAHRQRQSWITTFAAAFNAGQIWPMMKFVCALALKDGHSFWWLTMIRAQDSLNPDYNYNSTQLDEREDRESRARTERLALHQLDKARVRSILLLYTLYSNSLSTHFSSDQTGSICSSYQRFLRWKRGRWLSHSRLCHLIWH